MINCWKCRPVKKLHPEIKLANWIEQEKNPALKLAKKLETTGFYTVTQAQNYLKSINKKLKLWDTQLFRNQGFF